MTDIQEGSGVARESALLAHAVSNSENSLDRIGDGDWTPQDTWHQHLVRAAQSLLAALSSEDATRPTARVGASMAEQERPPNFRGDDGRLYLVRCFACGGEHGRENWVVAVADGTCAWCGWTDPLAVLRPPTPEGGAEGGC